WLLSLTRAAEQSVRATSTSVDLGFWNSEPAGRYLDAQHEAITDRGVPVRRLFLVERAAQLDDALLRLCEEQELLRIDVRVVVLPELPPHLVRGTTCDGVVFDEEVSYETVRDLREVNARTRIDARPDHVRSRTRRFEELWEAGMGLRELEGRVGDEEGGRWMAGWGRSLLRGPGTVTPRGVVRPAHRPAQYRATRPHARRIRPAPTGVWRRPDSRAEGGPSHGGRKQCDAAAGRAVGGGRPVAGRARPRGATGGEVRRHPAEPGHRLSAGQRRLHSSGADPGPVARR